VTPLLLFALSLDPRWGVPLGGLLVIMWLGEAVGGYWRERG
jgi:hypothetical protein